MKRYLLLLLLACNDNQPYVGPRSGYTADQAQTARESCTFKAGALPGLSLQADAPLGTQIPIDTFVIVMMENRTFDHLLGNFKAMQPDAEVSALDATNPDQDGSPVQFFHQSAYCLDDPGHGWNPTHLEWNGGKMDGFVTTNYDGPIDGKRVMGYYDETDMPFFYGVASAFAVADHSFASLLGPTFPNRAYLEGATSIGLVGGTVITDPHNNLVEILETAKITWRDYYSQLPTLGIYLDSLSKHFDNISMINYFFDDAAAGKLAQVNFVDPQLGNNGGGHRNDLHPPGNIQLGDQFLDQVVNAAMHSPQWPHMALIITFDEHGGFYDHVAPPPACPPDELEPILDPGDQPGRFDRYGIRIPTIVISPYSKPHYVSHHVYDHTSILRLLEARFIMPAMTARDANAEPLFDLFDFKKPPAFLAPPALPASRVDQAKMDECDMKFPPEPQM
jgi:phospholipase C